MTGEPRPFVLCLVGFPGVGKLTIAQTLERLTEAQIVDNHWINDPILRLVPHDSATPVTEAVWSLVARVRGAVLEAIVTVAPPTQNFIFTYAGSDEDPTDVRRSKNIGKWLVAEAPALCPFGCCVRGANWPGGSKVKAGTAESS
jgi:hypothetical protein